MVLILIAAMAGIIGAVWIFIFSMSLLLDFIEWTGNKIDKMKAYKLFHVKAWKGFGLAYWYDKYIEEDIGFNGWAHNFVIGPVRIQWAMLFAPNQSNNDRPKPLTKEQKEILENWDK